MQTRSRNNKVFNQSLSVTEETLSVMTDEELRKLFIELRSYINKNRRNKKFSKDKEVDFCYVQRELQLRKIARQSNKK